MTNKRPINIHDSINYIKKLKEALGPRQFENFKLSLHNFNQRKIFTSQLLTTFYESVGHDHDLLAGVNVFLPADYKINPNYGYYNWFSVKKASVDFFNNIRLAYQHDNDVTYKSFLNIMKKVADSEVVDRKKVFEEVDVLFKDRPEFSVEFTRLWVNGSGQTIQHVRCRDFKKKENSADDERVFEMEDCLYERDILKHHYESAIKQALIFLDIYSGTRDRDVQVGAAYEYFSFQDVRVMKKVCGDRSEEFEELLSRKPVSTLARIVPRMRQKYEELERYPEELKRKCQRIFRRMDKKVDEQGCVGISRQSVLSEKKSVERDQSLESEEGGGEEEERGWHRDKVESLVADPGSSGTSSVENSNFGGNFGNTSE